VSEPALHPATSILDDLARSLPLVACVLLDTSGTVRAVSRGPAESIEGGVLAAAVDELLGAAEGVLRTVGEARIEGVFVEGAGTHAFVRPFAEGTIVAVFDAAQATFASVRLAVRRQTEPLALLVQVEAPTPPMDRRALRRFLARL
jgi:predicted regulator of Ras-like GTPase activity (Roadblock/LC7/MglB family)